MSLINLTDFEITPKQKIIKKSPILLEAIRRLKKEKKYTEEEFEIVIDPFELILKCYEVSDDKNKKRGNTNARKV